ncbi:hypothetical protein J6590_059632 [Homalodisca vitripennis]|nr:hypothetical protein J6590_042813 [Homalodisca vitripennis]KAG8291461.1 hypothetical protein J6590_059632 [Homalodisca vitripennis]
MIRLKLMRVANYFAGTIKPHQSSAYNEDEMPFPRILSPPMSSRLQVHFLSLGNPVSRQLHVHLWKEALQSLLHVHMWRLDGPVFTFICGGSAVPSSRHLHVHLWRLGGLVFMLSSRSFMEAQRSRLHAIFTLLYGVSAVPSSLDLHALVWRFGGPVCTRSSRSFMEARRFRFTRSSRSFEALP